MPENTETDQEGDGQGSGLPPLESSTETAEQKKVRLDAEAEAKKTDAKEAARKKAAKEKSLKEKKSPVSPNKVIFEYYLRTMDKANHERLCIASGHRAQLKKEGRDKILKLIADWDKEINVIIAGKYVPQKPEKETKKKGEK